MKQFSGHLRSVMLVSFRRKLSANENLTAELPCVSTLISTVYGIYILEYEGNIPIYIILITI